MCVCFRCETCRDVGLRMGQGLGCGLGLRAREMKGIRCVERKGFYQIRCSGDGETTEKQSKKD